MKSSKTLVKSKIKTSTKVGVAFVVVAGVVAGLAATGVIPHGDLPNLKLFDRPNYNVTGDLEFKIINNGSAQAMFPIFSAPRNPNNQNTNPNVWRAVWVDERNSILGDFAQPIPAATNAQLTLQTGQVITYKVPVLVINQSRSLTTAKQICIIVDVDKVVQESNEDDNKTCIDLQSPVKESEPTTPPCDPNLPPNPSVPCTQPVPPLPPCPKERTPSDAPCSDDQEKPKDSSSSTGAPSNVNNSVPSNNNTSGNAAPGQTGARLGNMLPDLVVKDLKAVRQGDAINIEVTIKNIGTGPVTTVVSQQGPISSWFRIDVVDRVGNRSPFAGSPGIGLLLAGASQISHFSWFNDSTSEKVCVVADFNANVSESNENNNTLCRRISN